MTVEPKRGRGRPPKNPEPIPEMVESNNKKPTHDARLQYYKVLEFVMINMSNAALLGNYNGWYRTLKEFHIKIVAYVKPDKLKNLPVKFARARVLISQYESAGMIRDRLVQASTQNRISELDDVLFDIEEQLHIAAAPMMLPTKEDDMDAFDEEAFLRDSDL